MESIRLKKGAMLNNKNAVNSSDPNESPFSTVLAKYNLDHPSWDNLSHFVLRLAYSKTEELRRWLITQESLLFKYRFDTEKEEVISAFLKENDLNYAPLDEDELNQEINQDDDEDDGLNEFMSEERHVTVLLKDLLRQVPFSDIHQSIYYKVPFEDAIDLLRERKCFLKAGFAYVSRSNLSAIITTKFRTKFSQQLGLTCRAVSQIKQDVRIVPLLSMLSKQYITAGYKTTKIEGAVTKEQIPTLSERSFPLCMNNLQVALKNENHLKHGGRMQYGLFLKGIGLSLNDALAYWKTSFARRTPPEKFDKEYAYNIRHNYGKEGKRTTYTPYGCIKIIQGTPGPGDHHGCPFRQFEEATLRVKMKQKNFTQPQCDEVLSLVKGQHYQIACQRYYQYTHGGIASDNHGVGQHPNSYFDASEAYWREQEQGAKLTQSSQPTQASTSSTNTVDVKREAPAVYNSFPQSTPAPSAASVSTSSAAASTAAAAELSSTPLVTAPTPVAVADGVTPMELDTPASTTTTDAAAASASS